MRRGRPNRQLVERGPNGPAGVEHVIDDDDGLVVQVGGEFRLAYHRPGPHGLEIIPVKGDIQLPATDRSTFRGLDLPYQAFRQLHSATLDSDEHQPVSPMTTFYDFGSHAG